MWYSMMRQSAIGVWFEDNNGGFDEKKSLLHAKKWYIYNSEKQELVKGGYSVEVSDKDGKEVIWEVVDDHLFQDGVEHEALGLRGFDFNLFNEDWEGFIGEYMKQLPYLLMLINL